MGKLRDFFIGDSAAKKAAERAAVRRMISKNYPRLDALDISRIQTPNKYIFAALEIILARLVTLENAVKEKERHT